MLVRKLILEAYEHPYYLMELQKRNPPCLGDSVCVLEHITKEGTFHNYLEHNNINTVQDFVRMLRVKPDELRAVSYIHCCWDGNNSSGTLAVHACFECSVLWDQILGDGMTDDMWEETAKHARTCDPGDKVYVYTARGGTIYLNSLFDLVKVEIGGIEYPMQQLNMGQMVSECII